MTLGLQTAYLFLLAIPIACIAWTVTHEEVFKEPREFCVRYSKESKTLLMRKFFYLFTCEYCFSHYVTIGILFLTDYHLLFDDWRGYIIAGFSLVWIANLYMSLFGRLRIEIKKEKLTIAEKEVEVNQQKEQAEQPQVSTNGYSKQEERSTPDVNGIKKVATDQPK